MDRVHPFSTPHNPCHSNDQILKSAQKKFQRKTRSFERLTEAYSKGIRTLRITGRVRTSQIALKDHTPRCVAREFAQERDSFPGSKVPSNELSSDIRAPDGNNNHLEPCFVEEPTFNEQTGSGNSLQTTLEWYKRFFNNRPLMRCLDTKEDESLTNKLHERLLEESRRTIGQGLMVRLDSPTDDPGNLYEMLLRDTTQDVEHSLQESSRREMNVRAWWDNVRAQLRDEDKPA